MRRFEYAVRHNSVEFQVDFRLASDRLKALANVYTTNQRPLAVCFGKRM